MSTSRVHASKQARAVQAFRVELHPDRESVVVEVHGELCLASAPMVSEQLQELITGGFRRIVLDLRGVAFMDSTGVRLLAETDASAEARGCSFAIAIDAGQPSGVLDLVGMHDRPLRLRSEELPSA